MQVISCKTKEDFHERKRFTESQFPGSYYFIGHCCLYYDLDYLNRSDSYRSRALYIARPYAEFTAKILGHTWDEMFKNILHVVHGALPAIFLLLLVGFISASWIGSGTIPYMIYLGLELMHPTIYLFSAFLLCAIASIVTGSSWAIVSSLGIALIGIASGLGVPLPIAAGAIVSGCFLGDKWSPLSDTPNLAAATNRRDIVQIFTSMIPTSGIGAIIAAAAFLYWDFFFRYSANTDTSGIEILKSGITGQFSLISSFCYR